MFVGSSNKDKASRKYAAVSKAIREELDKYGELKSFGLSKSNKNRLYKVLSKEESLGLSVDISRVYDSILDNKNSIHRFKDYALKRLIKGKLVEMISRGLVFSNIPTYIHIFVDEQSTATDGIYSLRETIYEELKVGVTNFQYSTTFLPVFYSELICDVKFMDSSKSHLIQASDVLANRIWSSYKTNSAELRRIENHFCLRLP